MPLSYWLTLKLVHLEDLSNERVTIDRDEKKSKSNPLGHCHFQISEKEEEFSKKNVTKINGSRVGIGKGRSNKK